MILEALMRLRAKESPIPFDMFDHAYTDEEARRARRMESIYHVGQDRIWDGREVLAELIRKHGKPDMPPAQRKALARIFSIIMWGELAAWKISAQLSDELVPLEAKLAAASQVHDEARHFYVMHDYLLALGERPPPLDYWSRRVVELTLSADNMAKKLAGMQLTVETIALTLFQRVRELRVEPVLADLMPFYERDESRHVGLGVQALPGLMAKMSVAEHVDLGVFQLNLLFASLMGLKAMEKDLMSIGVDPRSILAVGYRKNEEVHKALRAEYPRWPEDPPVTRVFKSMSELVFPGASADERVPTATRVARAFDVLRRARISAIDEWNEHEGGKKAA